MTILSGLMQDAGKKERLARAVEKLTAILDAGAVPYKKEDLVLDEQEATVTVDGKYTFTWLDKNLRMMVPCQHCGIDQPSTPIHSLADISSLYEFPKTMVHACMDV
jgi:hypothetical protein